MKMTQSYFLLTLVTMKLLPKMFIKTVKKMFWSKWILKRFWMLCMIQQTKKLLESLKVKQTVKWLTLSVDFGLSLKIYNYQVDDNDKEKY